MGASSIFAVVLAIIVSLSVTGTQSARFTFKNNCPYKVWPGALTAANSPGLPTTGFGLNRGATFSLNAPARWSGRFWARTHCTSNGRFTCAVGDCGGKVACNGAGGAPPVTLAEFTLNGNGGKDFYDISLVDGFNVPMSINPQRGGCPTTSCRANINQVCPNKLAVRTANRVVGCKSACFAFGKPEYCCTGSHNRPETCPPTNYSKIFKRKCPQAYSYAYDDRSSTFTCASGGDYVITFCPR